MTYPFNTWCADTGGSHLRARASMLTPVFKWSLRWAQMEMLPHHLVQSVIPRLVLLIIESGHSSEPNALFCFMTNSVTLKGILRHYRALENHQKKFLCVYLSIFYCFPRGGSVAYVILSGYLEIKTFWELLNGRASSIHFVGDLLEDLSSGALLLPGFL